ncbi:MAG: fumarylacetoacetate hydrolase family protein [Planctomycetota bacterium]
MKIICIGRNYAEHAKELNNPIPQEPVFFMKPDTALVLDNGPFQYPAFSSDVQYEVEIVLRVSREGTNITEESAHAYYDAIGLGIDFTARDLQKKCKDKGLPWEKAKAFDQSAPVSRFLAKDRFEDLNQIPFSLLVNQQKRQDGNTKDLLFTFEKVMTHISRYVTLKKGDLIFTGTPEGVGPVERGDRLEGFIGSEKMLDFVIR